MTEARQTLQAFVAHLKASAITWKDAGVSFITFKRVLRGENPKPQFDVGDHVQGVTGPEANEPRLAFQLTTA